MSWQTGKRNRAGTNIRNGQAERQIVMSMKALNIPATPENREKLDLVIAGRRLSNKEIDELVKTTFAEEVKP